MTTRLVRFLTFAASVMGLAMGSMADEPRRAESAERQIVISAAHVDENGIQVHTITSPFQAGTTKISVLLPSELSAKQKCRVLYILPVEAGDGTRWGNALDEIRRLDLHNKHRLICVYPTFSRVPWYADHPTDSRIRQESYLLKVVVPFIEREYPAVVEARGRLLVGFSKSGWGAFSLLLRHPDVFAKAAAWDAPLGIKTIDRLHIGDIFGTPENFERYRFESLLALRGKELGEKPRLILAGANAFASEHLAAHELMTRLAIPHDYIDGKKYEHAWNGGWLNDAVERLVRE